MIPLIILVPNSSANHPMDVFCSTFLVYKLYSWTVSLHLINRSHKSKEGSVHKIRIPDFIFNIVQAWNSRWPPLFGGRQERQLSTGTSQVQVNCLKIHPSLVQPTTRCTRGQCTAIKTMLIADEKFAENTKKWSHISTTGLSGLSIPSRFLKMWSLSSGLTSEATKSSIYPQFCHLFFPTLTPLKQITMSLAFHEDLVELGWVGPSINYCRSLPHLWVIISFARRLSTVIPAMVQRLRSYMCNTFPVNMQHP